MSIQALLTFVKKHRTLFVFGAVFLGGLLFGAESLFANEGDPLINDEDFGKVIKILNGFITLAATLMGLVTSFISMFLYPGWVNGTLFGLQDYLREMWILVSNVVYFIFAFVLIAIAFMNIIGKGEGTWELKQAMPKFIVGVLIVPFSWFIVQFILSVSAILTVGVLTLPYESFSDHDLFVQALDNTELADQKICKDIVISFTGEFGEGAQQIGGEANDLDENIKCKNEDGEISIKELITGRDENGDIAPGADGLQNSVFGVISIYSYGILRIHELDSIFQKDLTTIKTLADLVFKIVFDLLFIAVYLLLMIALLLALFMRGVRLWVFMMLSPLFGLLYFFGKTGDGSGHMEKFSPKEFIALALVPVYVSAALAFGLVFILVASEGIKETSSSEDVLEAGGFSLTVIGAHGSGESEKSVIGKLIVEIFGVVILWIAVMSALGASKTTEAIVKPISDFGDSVGKLASAAPTYAPIIPTGNGERMGIAGLTTIGSSLEAAPRQAAQKSGGEFVDRIIGDASKTQQIARGLQGATSVQKQNGEALETALNHMGDGLFKSNQERRDQINHINTELGLDINLGSITDPQSIVNEIKRALDKSDMNYRTTFNGENSLSNFVRNLQDGNNSDNENDSSNSSTSNVDNNFNLTATIVEDATSITPDANGNIRASIDPTKIQGIRDLIEEVNIDSSNKTDIRAAIIDIIGGSQEEKEAKADALIVALGL